MNQWYQNHKEKIAGWFPMIGLVCLFLLFSITAGERFLSAFNLSNIVNQACIIMITGIGVCFIMSHNNLDLSCGGAMALCGVTTYLICERLDFVFLIPGCLIVGMLIGFLTGCIHVYGRIPAFLAGFAMMSLGRGISVISVEHKMRIPAMYKGLNTLVFYIGVLLAVSMTAVFVMKYTKIGKYNKLIGANPVTAKMSGIIICCMITGVLLGGLVGLLYYFTGVPTIIASLGIMFVYESFGSIVFEGKGINISSTKWVVMSNVTWGVLLAIVVGIFAHFVFYRTKFGYNVRAVGSSMAIAGNSGIKVPVVKALCLTLVGLFAGIYAAVNLCSVGVIRPVSAMGTMATCFDAMMCCFIGFSICFGKNQVISIFFGAFTMQILKLALLVFGFPTDYNSVVTAFFILIFIFISNNQDRFASIRKKAVKA